MRKFLPILFALFCARLSLAQLLSADINKTESPRPDDTAPGFVGWYDMGTGQAATHLFTWTNTIASGIPQNFAPPGYPNSSMRFYRAASVQ